MGLISWIIIGLIVGFIARYLFPGRTGILWPALVLATAGALIGGYIRTYANGGTLATFDPHTLLTALVGAMVMTGIVKILRI